LGAASAFAATNAGNEEEDCDWIALVDWRGWHWWNGIGRDSIVSDGGGIASTVAVGEC